MTDEAVRGARIIIDSLVQRLREAEERAEKRWEVIVGLEKEHEGLLERAEKAEKWLRFIADTQHRLLEAIHLEITDEEWAAFAEALELGEEAK